MADDQDKDGKSEEPSETKLRKAREKGDVPVSREAGHMLGYGALLALAMMAGNGPLLAAMHRMGNLFASAAQAGVGEGMAGVADIGPLVAASLGPAVLLLAAALGILFAASVVAGGLQGPFVVSGERVRPKLNRLSPARGLKRILSVDHLVDFLKNLLKLAMIGTAGLWVVWSLLGVMLPGTSVEPEWLPGLMQSGATRVLAVVTLIMVPIAVFDLFWKRRAHLRKQRMSHKELRDEHKDAEGDPLIAAKRAQLRRQRSRQRILQAVPTATLVITNPTHFAVALRYQRGVDAAPVCVAKGADRVAARIRKIAHESDIPVIESPALARALYASADLDQAIPEAHWQAVARLVTYVFDLRRRIRRKPPEGARLRAAGDDAPPAENVSSV